MGKAKRTGRGGDRVNSDRIARELADRFAVMQGDADFCGKVRFPTKQKAVRAAGLTAAHDDTQGGFNGADGRHRLTAYRCQVCPGRPWHFGHRSLRR